MKKSLARELYIHYGYRYELAKYNLRNTDQLITPYDRYILDNLNKGVTLALELIGHQYSKFIPNLVIDEIIKVDNIIAVNSMFFKYQTLEQIGNKIDVLQNNLNKNGKLFVSFNFQFVNFNRLKFDFDTECAIMLENTGLKVCGKIVKPHSHTNPYGNNFFILQKDD